MNNIKQTHQQLKHIITQLPYVSEFQGFEDISEVDDDHIQIGVWLKEDCIEDGDKLERLVNHLGFEMIWNDCEDFEHEGVIVIRKKKTAI